MRACSPHMAKALIFFISLAPLSAQRAVLVTPMGHSEALASFVYSNDGKHLVTASNDRSARIWENNSRKLLFTLNGHSDALTSASFNPNGNRIVTASADGSACLWNAWTGEKIFCLPDHRSTVFHAGFTRDGRYLFTETHAPDEKVRIWDALTGKIIHEMEGHLTEKGNAFLSPDGKKITSASRDGSIYIYDLVTGRMLHRITGHRKAVYSSVFSPDGKRLITASADSTARIWDVFTGRQLLVIEGHQEKVTDAQISADGRFILTLSHDRSPTLWDGKTGEPLYSFLNGGYIFKAVFSPSGSEIATLGNDGRIRTWESSQGTQKLTLPVPGNQALDIAYSPDGSQIAVACADGSMLFFDTLAGEPCGILKGYAADVYAGEISNDGKYLAAGGNDSILRIYDYVNGKLLHAIHAHEGAISRLSFNRQGSRIFSTSTDQKAHIWDAGSGKRLATVHADESDIIAAAFSPDGLSLASGSMAGNVRISRSDDGLPLKTLREIGPAVQSIVYSPKGAFLAYADREGVCHVYTTDGSEKIHTYRSEGPAILSIRFSPDEKLLTAGLENGEILVWHMDSRLLRNRYKTTAAVTELHFSHKGHLLAAANGNGEIILVQTQTGAELFRLEKQSTGIQSLAFSASDDLLFTGCENGEISTWSTATGGRIHTDASHKSRVTGLFQDPGGRYLLSTSQDGSVKTWDMLTGQIEFTLLGLPKREQMIIHHTGLFDLSDAAAPYMHFVVLQQKAPPEIIELQQLKYRYYEPGIWTRVLRNEAFREVASLDEVKLWPDANAHIENDRLQISLKARNGGIGKIQLYVRGKEIVPDLRSEAQLKTQDSLNLSTALLPYNHFMLPDMVNALDVYVWNAEGTISSRPIRLWYKPGKPAEGAEIMSGIGATSETRGAAVVRALGNTSTEGLAIRPRLYGICAGISNYTGDQIDLAYAAKDAEDFAGALRQAGELLFGKESIDITLINGSAACEAPTRTAILKALDKLRDTRPGDVVVVYLSGHGIARFDEFFFLCAEASDAAAEYLRDRTFARSVSISSEELTAALNAIPADKKVLIIDACNSGMAAQRMAVATRDMPSSQIRALDRMRGRSGLYVLAGSAADMPSYEASRFGQGLLTYSLLKGIKGAALRSEGYFGFVDIAALLHYATEEVPRLAKEIAGIQQPQFMTPTGAGSFDIGMVDDSVRNSIRLAEPKPVFIRPQFVVHGKPTDEAGLTRMVSATLFDMRSKGKDAPISFVDAGSYPGSYQISGTYALEGKTVRVDVYVLKDGTREVARFPMEGDLDDLPALAILMIEQARTFAH